jgi:hypothetical protein
MADAPDRAAFGVAQELLLAPGEQRHQRLPHQPRPRAKSGTSGGLANLFQGHIQLAVVAAVDAVAHERPQFLGMLPGVLDGQVGDAAARIQPVRRHDRAGGADVDAGAAVPQWSPPARWPARQSPRRSRPGRTSSRLRGSAPACGGRASPGRCARPVPLQHRRRVCKDAMAEGADRFADALGSASAGGNAAPCDSPGPARKARRSPPAAAPGARTRSPASLRACGGKVVHACGNHACRARHQFRGAGAAHSVACHVGHLAVKTVSQPREQPGFGARKIDAGHADLGKSELAGPVPDLGQKGPSPDRR